MAAMGADASPGLEVSGGAYSQDKNQLLAQLGSLSPMQIQSLLGQVNNTLAKEAPAPGPERDGSQPSSTPDASHRSGLVPEDGVTPPKEAKPEKTGRKRGKPAKSQAIQDSCARKKHVVSLV